MQNTLPRVGDIAEHPRWFARRLRAMGFHTRTSWDRQHGMTQTMAFLRRGPYALAVVMPDKAQGWVVLYRWNRPKSSEVIDHVRSYHIHTLIQHTNGCLAQLEFLLP